MNNLGKQLSTLLILVALAAPCISAAQTSGTTPPARKPAAAAPAQDVAAPQDAKPAGLLLPAVQKATATDEEGATSAPAPRSVQQAPQKGVEPDEIDVATRVARPPAGQAREMDKASPKLAERSAGGGSMSVQQMMLKLKPRQPAMVASKSGSGPAAANSVQAKPAEPPKYEIADCGTAVSPMICCHHEDGDGSSCSLFMILCENAGGTAQGNAESAACSDW